jgi:hypothetical protein
MKMSVGKFIALLANLHIPQHKPNSISSLQNQFLAISGAKVSHGKVGIFEERLKWTKEKNYSR